MMVSFDLIIGKRSLYCENVDTRSGDTGFFNLTKGACLDKVRSDSNIPLGLQFDFVHFDPLQPMPAIPGGSSRLRRQAGAQLSIRSKDFESNIMIDSAHLSPCKRTKISPIELQTMVVKAFCDYRGPKTLEMTPRARSKSTTMSMPVVSRAMLDSKPPSGWTVTDFKAMNMAHSRVST
jgi:hypothetical protein